MTELYYTYNNEAITSCIFLSVLTEVEKIDIARLCLVLPFLLDDRTVSYLNKIDDNNITIQQMIKERPRLFLSFYKRFVSLTPVAINALMILNDGGQVLIEKESIMLSKVYQKMEEIDMGARFQKIKIVIPKLMSILKSNKTAQLYKILNIQL